METPCVNFQDEASDDDSFSWSYSRWRIFNTCRRAYFWKYYGSRGGVDPFAEPLLRKAYTLKKLVPLKLWIKGILSSSLRETFQRQPVNFISEFKRIAHSKYMRDLSAVFNEDWKKYPDALNIFELYYSKMRPADLEKVSDLIDAMTARLQDAGIIEVFASIDMLNIRLHKVPLSFELNGTTCWLAPDLIRDEKGRFEVLFLNYKSAEADPEEFWQIAAGLAVLYLSRRYHRDADKIECVNFFSDGMLAEKRFSYADPASVIEVVKLSSSQMKAFPVSSDPLANIEFFRADANPQSCALCQFQEICSERKNV